MTGIPPNKPSYQTNPVDILLSKGVKQLYSKETCIGKKSPVVCAYEYSNILVMVYRRKKIDVILHYHLYFEKGEIYKDSFL